MNDFKRGSNFDIIRSRILYNMGLHETILFRYPRSKKYVITALLFHDEFEARYWIEKQRKAYHGTNFD